MQNTMRKIGSIILVHGVRPRVGTSTAAAMIASLLAAHGERTVLISSDADLPFDATSILSDDVSTNHLDELLVMSTSVGVNKERLGDCVSMITDNLGYIRCSSRVTDLTPDPVTSLTVILQTGCYDFRYVVMDVGYGYSPFAEHLFKCSDVIVHVLAQDQKCLNIAASMYQNHAFPDDTFVIPLLMGYDGEMPGRPAVISKASGGAEVFEISRDPSVAKAADVRDIASFVSRNLGHRSGLFSRRKKEGENPSAVEEMNTLVELMMSAINDQNSSDEE